RYTAPALRRRLAGSCLRGHPGLLACADAAAHYQGLSHLPPGSCAMGADPDFCGPGHLLHGEYAPLLQPGHRPRLPERGQPPEPDGHLVSLVRVHGTVHLSHVEPGGPEVLDSRATAAAT